MQDAGADGGAVPASPPPLDTTCHCLVIDASKADAGADAHKQLAAALLLAGNQPALQQHVGVWLPALALGDVSAMYADRTSRLHINFLSAAGLGRALATLPCLVRCGSTVAGPWHGKQQVCGLAKHLQPELLRLTCEPTDDRSSRELAKLTAAIGELLASMKLEHTSFWIPNSANPARRGTSSLTINVLPRETDAARLRALIDGLHLQHRLWGGVVSIEAPNQRALSRCRLCAQLGHLYDGCPRYAGFALRLLFKQPLPIATLRDLVQRLGARDGYLGASVDELQPHRKVSLLFDGDGDDEATLRPVLERLLPLLPELSGKLHAEPTVVNPKNRQRECAQCNSPTRAHECPFGDGAPPRRPQPAPAPHNELQPVGALVGAAALGAGRPARPAAPTAPADNMCRSWRQRKQCPRKASGRACAFEHPEAHVPQRPPCFAFQGTGFCNRGDQCPFEHRPRPPLQLPQPQSQPQAAAAPLPQQAAAPQSAGVAQRPPAAAGGSAQRPQASSASKKKGVRPRDPPQSSAAAAAAASPGPAPPPPDPSWASQVENATEEEVKENEARAAAHGGGRRKRPSSPAGVAPPSSLEGLGSPSKAKRQATSQSLNRSSSTGGNAAEHHASPSRRQ
jgi:hypothetical protein